VTREEAIASAQRCVDRLLAGKEPLRVLEAGCGSAAHVRVPAGAHVVGVDLSARQLERHPGLHERIQADLQEVALPARAFDLVVCWEVLEHLPEPERALARLADAVAEGGALVLAVPNLLSVKGLVTRLTPHWFHVAFYRHVYRVPGAGEDDQAPFTTHLRASIREAGLRQFAAAHGLEVALVAAHDVGPYLHTRHRAAGALYEAIRGAARALSRGAIGDSDLVMVLRRANAA
jgi:2-polyprenyl-3-methyl-5-hydroxy-6-metoxy-1,4-benzoquinol methylase